MVSDDYLDTLVRKYGHRVFAKYSKGVPPDAVYIGRPTQLGNPVTLTDTKSDKERIQCVYRYRDYLHKRILEDKEFVQLIRGLKGKSVTCWCSNGTTSVQEGARYCHGHILLAAVDYVVGEQEG